MLNNLKGFVLLGSVALLSACGQNPLSNAFKNISISNIDQNGDAIVELRTEVGSGNIIFATGTLPIVDPKTGKDYGTISMERTLDGKNILLISANVTGIKLGHVLSDNKLPNGANVPIAGLSSLVAVPAGKSSRIYIGTTTSDEIVVGAAVAVKEFDSLAGYIPGASIFFNLSQTSQVNGLGGFFTSSESGKSGIALFAEVQKPSILGLGVLTSGVSAKIMSDPKLPSQLKFIQNSPTSNQSYYLGYFLNKWSSHKTSLKLK
jgi:hypothetical protein